MTTSVRRREFLKASAAFAAASAAGGFGCVEIASAQPIQVPTIDKLTMRVLIDQVHDQFLRGSTVNGVVHDGPGPSRSADARNVLHNQWGLSLFLETQRDQEQRAIMLDFGYTAAALINNIGLLRIDPSKVRALIVSHGHVDHYGGLIGFLGQYRNAMPADLKLYAGGEDNFCHRLSGSTPGQLGENGTLERRQIDAHKVTDGAVRDADDRRGSRLHHRQDQARQRRARAAERLRRLHHARERGLRLQPFHAGRDAGQAGAGPARARARHLLQHPRQGTGGDLIVRPCRHRQFGAAGAGGVRRPEGSRHRRRLPPRARRRPTISSRSWPRSGSSSPMC